MRREHEDAILLQIRAAAAVGHLGDHSDRWAVSLRRRWPRGRRPTNATRHSRTSNTTSVAGRRSLPLVPIGALLATPAMPKLDALEQMGVDVERVNIDKCSETTKRYYGITSVPVYFVIRCGHETVRTQDIDEAVRLMNEVFGRS